MQWEKLDFNSFDVLCLYGEPEEIPDFVYKWLDEKNRYLAIISTDEKDYGHDKIRVFLVESWLFFDMVLKRIAWEFVFLRVKIIFPQEMEAQMREILLGVHLVASEYVDGGLAVLKNTYLNLQKQTKNFSPLKDSCKNSPAIICGAGSSLDLEFLRKEGDKALIFAGGKSLEILINENIHIDFAGGVDKQYRLKTRVKAPLFFSGRFLTENLRLIDGPLIKIPSQGDHPLEQLFSGGEPLDSGWTVATFLFAIALYMGCNPIVLMGVDLAYHKGQKYKDGSKPDLEEIVEERGFLTQKDWILAAKWLEGKRPLYPDREFINISLGMPLKGFIHKMGDKIVLKGNKANLHPLLDSLPDIKSGPFLKEILESNNRCKAAFANENFFELIKEEIVYSHFLKPAWDMWHFVFKREFPLEEEYQMNKRVFYKELLEKHEAILCLK